jgi:hypothetical protein
VFGCAAALLRWLADQIDPPHPITDEALREMGDMVWTDTDCSLLHKYADD